MSEYTPKTDDWKPAKRTKAEHAPTEPELPTGPSWMTFTVGEPAVNRKSGATSIVVDIDRGSDCIRTEDFAHWLPASEWRPGPKPVE